MRLEIESKDGNVPKEHIEARFGASVIRSAFEIHQLDATTGLPSFSSFPFKNFTPGAFIDRIVDWNDCFHVHGLWVVILAGHGCKELSFRWIDPFPVIRFGY